MLSLETKSMFAINSVVEFEIQMPVVSNTMEYPLKYLLFLPQTKYLSEILNFVEVNKG